MSIAPIEIQVHRYKCPGCEHDYRSKSAARKHIKRCQRIRANHGCKTCACFCPAGCSSGIDLSDELKLHCKAWEAIF